ncbi:ABC transporter permease [Hymenobacter metallicola]
MAGYWGNSRLRVPAVVTGWLVILGAGASCISLPTPELVWWLGLAVLGGLALWLATRNKYAATWPVPVDKLVLLLIAFLTAIPRLILVLALAAVQEPSQLALLIVLTLTYWPVTAQIARATMQRIRHLSYIEAAYTLGLPNWRIIIGHALPSIWNSIKVTLPLGVAALIGIETTLSFLGVGLPPQTASWGRILATARLDPTAWWLIVFPSTCIVFTMLALRQITFSSQQE